MQTELSLAPAALAARLLACPSDEREAWLAAERPHLALAVVEELKRYSDAQLLADPPQAEAATGCALALADQLPDEPLALALASWARGNWANYHDPQQAVGLYERALAGFRAAGDGLSVARLLSNLVAPLTECGRFADADAAYAEARALLAGLPDAALYLMRLEQNVGVLRDAQGQYAAALDAHDRALALAHRIGQSVAAIEVQVNRTLTLGMLGRLAEGEAALLTERANAEAHGQALTVARIDMILGELYAVLGRPADSLRRFEAARERFAALGNPMEAGSVLLGEGLLFERIGALREARRSYGQAREQFAALQLLPQVGIALVQGAAASRRDGALPEARSQLDQADAIWRELAQPLWCAEVALERAALLLAAGDPSGALSLLADLAADANAALAARRSLLAAEAHAARWRTAGDNTDLAEAQRSFEHGLAYGREQGDRQLQRQSLVGLARLALFEPPNAQRARSAENNSSPCPPCPPWQRSLTLLEEVAALDERTRAALSVEELKASFQAQSDDALPLLARLHIEQGDGLRALHAIWRGRGGGLLDLLYEGQRARSHPHARDRIAQVRQQLASQRWRAAREPTDEDAAGRHEPDDPAIRALEQQLFDLRRKRAVAGAPEDHDLVIGATAPTALAATGGLLRVMASDLLLEYATCDGLLLGVCADSSGACHALTLCPIDTVLDLLDALQLSFQNVLTQPPAARARYRAIWGEECLPLLRECYELLVAPFGPLPAGARLLIAPGEQLAPLPFAALHDGQRHLVECCELLLVPSGALLAAPPLPPASAAPPLVVASSAEGALPAVAAEVAAVAAALPDARCLLDDPAALPLLARLDEAPRVLHLAAHSIQRDDAPIFSALQFNGGMLSVEQCYDLPLAGTELVVLSGCTTGAGLDTGGALLAFQSALLVAGARHILSTLWPIDDGATATFMTHFYRHLAAGHRPAAALRRAQRDLLADPALGHPALWAAFVCTGRPCSEDDSSPQRRGDAEVFSD